MVQQVRATQPGSAHHQQLSPRHMAALEHRRSLLTVPVGQDVDDGAYEPPSSPSHVNALSRMTANDSPGPSGTNLESAGACSRHQGPAAYMDRVQGSRNLRDSPGRRPAGLIPRLPRAVLTYGVFVRHPHPDYECGCEWDDTWRMVWALPTEPGAVPVTSMRHPTALAPAGIPDPDHGAPATWAP